MQKFNMDLNSRTSTTTPGEIKSVPSSEEILKLLECPCCLEAPVPPIKICATGHIICSFCRPRLTRCVICREPYTDCRNYALEAIFNGCQIACKYWGTGCQDVVLGDNFVEHVRICKHRSLCCSHCQESVSPVEEYVTHLKQRHQASGYDEELNSYTYSGCLVDLIHNDIRFPDQYAVFDGKYFIASAQIRSQYMQIWVSSVENLLPVEPCGEGENTEVLANLKKSLEETKYTAVVSLAPETSPIPSLMWIVPISPLQNGDPEQSCIVTVPMNPTFRGFLTAIQDENSDVIKYTWSFKYSISFSEPGCNK